jgi:hypothetical protein
LGQEECLAKTSLELERWTFEHCGRAILLGKMNLAGLFVFIDGFEGGDDRRFTLRNEWVASGYKNRCRRDCLTK